MDEIEFIFQTSAFDAEIFMPQVSRALEERLMEKRRQLNPKSAREKDMTEAERKQQKTKKIIWGVVGLALGAYLIVTGIGAAKESRTGMLIGILAAALGLNSLRSLIPQRKPKNRDRYDNAAKEFLEGHLEIVEKGDLQICFAEGEMVLVKGDLDELDQDVIEFDEIDMVAEGDEFFLLTFRGRGMMLQKKDISFGTVDEFREFASKIKPIVDVKEPVEAPEAAETTETAETEEEN